MVEFLQFLFICGVVFITALLILGSYYILLKGDK